jgi:uncharacterized protein
MMAPVRLLIVVILATIGISAVQAAPSFPALTGRVVDQAGVIDPAVEARLDVKLADLEQKTRIQLVVATLRSLQGYDIADYGYQLGRAWGIGQKGADNGALLIVAPAERKVRIEVGYGLEGILTDAVARLIIDNAILPRFRAGDFSGGIERGVDDLVQLLSGDAEDFKRRAAEQRPTGKEGWGTFIVVLVILAIWLLLFLRQSRQQQLRTRRRPGWIWGIPAGGGWASGRSSGLPSGGGFGGGFSGGGGSFGGGGASGSW